MICNPFGEVVAVNGLITGERSGTPMQDATPNKPEDNDKYAIANNCVTRISNSKETWDCQPNNNTVNEELISTLMNNPVFNILGEDPNSFAIKVNKADNKTVINALGEAGAGIYTLYVQKGVSDNPTGSNSSCRGLCCVNTWYSTNEFYAWILLFDSDGNLYTRYNSAYGSSDWKQVTS